MKHTPSSQGGPAKAAAYFRRELLSLSRHSYLLCGAVDSLTHARPSAIAAKIPGSVRALCNDPDRLHGSKQPIEMTAATVRRQLKVFPAWSLRILFVELDSLLHGTLDLLAGRPYEADSPRVEDCIGAFISTQRLAQTGLAWAYRDAVLLAVFRNCLVHAEGQLHPPHDRRLLDAGWTEAAWRSRISWTSPGFDDFLLFKKAVRSIANACIQEAGHAPAVNSQARLKAPHRGRAGAQRPASE